MGSAGATIGAASPRATIATTTNRPANPIGSPPRPRSTRLPPAITLLRSSLHACGADVSRAETCARAGAGHAGEDGNGPSRQCNGWQDQVAEQVHQAVAIERVHTLCRQDAENVAEQVGQHQ